MQNETNGLVIPQHLETTTNNEQSPSPHGEGPFTKILSSVPLRASCSHHTAPVPFPLPQRGFSSALITGVIAGVLAALLTILIILINMGMFHAARLQIAVDKLTVKTALALAVLDSSHSC